MEETILFPTPNWFQVSVLAVGKDGWIVYGGPSKSICVLEPIEEGTSVIHGKQRFHAHVLNRAYTEKVVSVDLSPLWPEQRNVLVGSTDGQIKIWNLEKVEEIVQIKSALSHDVHVQEKEEVVGVGYTTESFAISVGSSGVLTRWNLSSNTVKTNSQMLKHFKPLCMACSPHIQFQVAVGTKQGVVFVLDFNGNGKIVYKVRSQDDEVLNISWCPRLEVSMKTCFITTKTVAERLLNLEGGQSTLFDSPLEDLPEDKRKRDSITSSKSGEKDSGPLSRSEDKDSGILIKSEGKDSGASTKPGEKDSGVLTRSEETKQTREGTLDQIVKEAESQGKDVTQYLQERVEKSEELKKVISSENVMGVIEEAVDKIHIEGGKAEDGSSSSDQAKKPPGDIPTDVPELASEMVIHGVTVGKDYRIDVQRHLLATIGRSGAVRIWDKSGKLVGSCSVPYTSGKNLKIKHPTWATLLWHKDDVLLIGDGRSQLLKCNPLVIDLNNRMEWKLVHTLHKRGLFLIASNAPRVQTDDEAYAEIYEKSLVWTVSQDRQMTCYSLSTNEMVALYTTCGAFIYSIQTGIRSGSRVAITVGDGTVRVLESDVKNGDTKNALVTSTKTFWQNVQGKVLSVAWNRFKENLVAFGTAESRVGVIDVNKVERPAKVLLPALSGAVYSISWGENNLLYACAGGRLVIYHVDKLQEAPEVVDVAVEGRKQSISTVYWCTRGLLCGSNTGTVAMYTSSRPHKLITAAIIFSKMIHSIDWHPQSFSNIEVSAIYKNLVAVCSLDKQNYIILLDYKEDEESEKKLYVKSILRGHKATILQVSWSPFKSGLLLSTSNDATVRIWEALEGECMSIFPMHTQTAYCATWCGFPQFNTKVISGGADCCVRMWDINAYPASEYDSSIHEVNIKRERKKKDKKEETSQADAKKNGLVENEKYAATLEATVKGCKKFLLPLTYKQMNPCRIKGAKLLLKRYMQIKGISIPKEMEGYNNITETEGYEYLNIFGSLDDLNKWLDVEVERQLQYNPEGWVVLSAFRGHIANIIETASEKDLLDPFVMNMAPSLSTKAWSDAMKLYVTQIDRLRARRGQLELEEIRHYGGPVFRKAVILVLTGAITEAVELLVETRYFMEAFVLSKIRCTQKCLNYLKIWAEESHKRGTLITAATCYIALGDLYGAATVLAKASDIDLLNLAVDCATVIDCKTLKAHVDEKMKATMSKSTETDVSESMDSSLPTRVELAIVQSKESETDDGVSETPQSASIQ